ncbi:MULTISPECIES: hypothetical protein [Rhizobium]|uniref:Uncharacterized protein n=1 Tax=Rhizobium tropici TaxID=398 RepID=A0A6P1BYJ2_RHITR|nr:MULTISPECIES: hypothetical protein [Rhizobium]MBB4239490.1 hypothetical protein [Rhizobium tropici]MBB5590760.1 hypothetical protein [Rhizobium tropici]MBB6490031.1 hypothetical protein [Rhizobium tropici]NEV09478.1 hypothetical protein [Rhizobium tropici]
MNISIVIKYRTECNINIGQFAAIEERSEEFISPEIEITENGPQRMAMI